MVQTIKFSQFANAALTVTSNQLVGVSANSGGTNVKTPLVNSWTTLTRPLPPYNGLYGYNSTLNAFEFWNGVAWIQFETGSSGTVTQVDTGTGVTGGPITTTGTISFAPIAAESLWANVTAFPNVPTVVTIASLIPSLPFIVGSNGPYFTIQSAIDAAALVASSVNKQIVLINSGTYNENLTLKSFVSLSSFGGASQGAINIIGNADYAAANDNEAFSASGIMFQTPGGGGPAFNISGVKICNVLLTRCYFNGTAGECFSSSNGNASVNLGGCVFNALTGQKIFNISDGDVVCYSMTVSSADTASLINGSKFFISASFIEDAYILGPNTEFVVLNSTIVAPDSLSVLDIDATSSATVFCAILGSAAASGFYATGTGTIAIDGAITNLGSAGALDPALTFQRIPFIAPGISFNGGSNKLDVSGNFDALFTFTANTNVTFPTSGTLATAGVNTDITALEGLTGTLRAPTGITSTAGENLLTFTYIASAVNNFNISNNSVGTQPIFSVEGSDSNISMVFQAKGSGNYVFLGTSSQAANIKLREDTDNGTNSIGIRPPNAITTDYEITLPAAVGATNTILKAIDASGTLDFTNGSQVLGTATNDDASSGNIGEYISSSVLVGSAVSLTTGTPANVTSISLTAGDWDVRGQVAFGPNAATTTTRCFGAINTTSATLPTTGAENNLSKQGASQAAGESSVLAVGPMRISVAGATTVYLVTQATFAVNTLSAYGFIGARRVR